MQKIKINTAICLLCVFALFFTGCSLQKEKILIDTDTLQVITTGNQTTVQDLAGDQVYNFRTVRVKKGSANTGSKTTTNTDTIKIITLQGGGFEIHDRTAGKIYTIKRGRLID